MKIDAQFDKPDGRSFLREVQSGMTLRQ